MPIRELSSLIAAIEIKRGIWALCQLIKLTDSIASCSDPLLTNGNLVTQLANLIFEFIDWWYEIRPWALNGDLAYPEIRNAGVAKAINLHFI